MDTSSWERYADTVNFARRNDLYSLALRLGCRRCCDTVLLERALTHRSYVNEARENGLLDNERLEFLGDAVLQLSVSEALFVRFPEFNEGDLSKIRASLVTEQSLSHLARRYGIGDFLLLGKGEDASGGRNKDSILANAFEAIMAAVFIDQGYEEIQMVVTRVFAPLLDSLEEEPLYRDYKSRLQELSYELFQTTPIYRTAGARGPDHDKIYDVEVLVTNEIQAMGSGKSKKEAEQQAARRALAKVTGTNDTESP